RKPQDGKGARADGPHLIARPCRRGDRMRVCPPKWPEIVLLRDLRARAVSLAAFAVFAAFDSAAAVERQCTCRALGRSFELGQTACLSTPKGPRMAICVMVLNMTSWQISDTPCVGARMRNHQHAIRPAGIPTRAQSELACLRDSLPAGADEVIE